MATGRTMATGPTMATHYHSGSLEEMGNAFVGRPLRSSVNRESRHSLVQGLSPDAPDCVC